MQDIQLHGLNKVCQNSTQQLSFLKPGKRSCLSFSMT